jgi:perosamine synthetase
LVPDLTFIAPVNAVRYCGAYPVFMDVEADYGQIDPSKIRRFLSTECEQKDGILINKQSGRHVRAMIPVHLLGHPCDMDPLMKLAKQYNLLVIEDASQSLGAVYKGKRVGSIGDIGCFSFNGNKIITTGGGGMLTTRHAAWAARAVYLTTQARDSATEFTHDTIGYNYRLTNIQAAVGLAQMEQLDAYIRIKHRIAKRYEAALRSVCGFTLPKQAPWAQSTDWLFTVRVDPDRFGMTCSQLRDALERQQIQTRTLWAPIHQQKPYRQCQTYEIDIAEKLYHTALSLPCSVGLTQKDQDRVIQAIKTIEKGKAKLARP